MAKKPVDPLKAKQKKQKIVAAVLGVVFVGLLVFQVPRVLKRLHPAAAPPPPASTTTTPTGTPTLAAPTLAGSDQAPSAAGSGSLTASAAAPAMQDGQLASFSLFASKDPFAQQLSDDKTSSSSTSSSRSSSTGGSSSSGSASGPGSAAPGSKAPTPGAAVISVNGTLYSVAVGTDFPQASTTDPLIVPLFHLLSLTAHSAKISIVGGSYANGVPAVTLMENKPVTLMNTANGTRYKLILKPVGTAVTAPAAPTSTTSTTVTVPPPPSP